MAIRDFFNRILGIEKRESFIDAARIAQIAGSGVVVNKQTAMSFSAVWNAVRILSESVAQLPLHIYQRNANGDRDVLFNHKLYDIVHSKPNNYQTKYLFMQKIMYEICIYGNSYVYIERTNGGIPTALYCMDANEIDVIKKDDAIFYVNHKDGHTYSSEEVMHFRGLSTDGIKGMSPIDQCSNSIGWGIAVEAFGNSFFRNGAKLSGILQTDRTMTEEAIGRLRNSFNQNYSSIQDSLQTMVLEEGLKFNPVSISNEQAQFLASRTFAVEEVARVFNIPPHMLKDLSKSSFNNIEMQSQEFVTYTLMPYLSNIEAEMNTKLFKESERGKVYVEFNVNGLLRGSVKDRAEYYRTMLNIGAMTINEIRQKENMNSVKEGDELWMQINMTTVDKIVNQSETPIPPTAPQTNGNYKYKIKKENASK